MSMLQKSSPDSRYAVFRFWQMQLSPFRLMLCVAALVIQCAICRNVAGQEVQLPVRLSLLNGTGKFFRFQGFEFSSFVLQEVGGGGIAAATVVNGWSDGVFNGLSFDIEGDSLGVAGVDGNKELNMSYNVSSATGADRVGAVKVSLDANTVGYGLAGVGIGLSDQGGNPPVATSLGSTSASLSQVQSSEKSLAFLALQSTTDVLGVAGGIYANAYLVGDNAVVHSVKHVFALEGNVMEGDFTFNGVVDGADFLFWQRTFDSTLDLQADGSKNGKVDIADYTIWRNNYGAQIGPPGDFDGDGRVDGNDFLKWQRALETNDPTVDANKSGSVDQGDLSIWRSNFGTGTNAQVTASTVPEPTAGLLGLGFAWTLMTKVIASRPRTVL